MDLIVHCVFYYFSYNSTIISHSTETEFETLSWIVLYFLVGGGGKWEVVSTQESSALIATGCMYECAQAHTNLCFCDHLIFSQC